MTKTALDPVKVAKAVSKETGIPLPKVAQVFQKYPLDGPNLLKARDECLRLAAEEMKKTLNTLFLI